MKKSSRCQPLFCKKQKRVTIVRDARFVPPILANTGAARWTKRNVEMNGVVTWEIVVNVFTTVCRTRSLGFDMFTRERVCFSIICPFEFYPETKIKHKWRICHSYSRYKVIPIFKFRDLGGGREMQCNMQKKDCGPYLFFLNQAPWFLK